MRLASSIAVTGATAAATAGGTAGASVGGAETWACAQAGAVVHNNNTNRATACRRGRGRALKKARVAIKGADPKKAAAAGIQKWNTAAGGQTTSRKKLLLHGPGTTPQMWLFFRVGLVSADNLLQPSMLDWPPQIPVVSISSLFFFRQLGTFGAWHLLQPAPLMPPLVIDLRKTEDARDVVHRAVQALAEGKLVAFPTETDYVIAASARDATAVGRLIELSPQRPAEPRVTLALKSADEALDWAPRLSAIGRRISRRCWPGPVAIIVADEHQESLVHRLPLGARSGIVGAGRLRLRVPGHPMLADCMRMLAGPVALAEPCAAETPPVTALDVMALADGQLALVIDDGRARYAQPHTTIEVDDYDFRIVHPGIVSEETMRRLSSLMVLFVCTGNTCRSPMAETIFRQLVAERLECRPEEIQSQGVVVASSGIAAWGGGKASVGATEVMAETGGDLSGHESQPLTENLVRQADLIWTMTAAHRTAILAQFPEAGGRVAMLSPDRMDVIDPIGGTVATYRKCAQQIRALLVARLATILLPGFKQKG